MPVSIAIIGSGPAGFYAADALIKACTSCQVDIIERLPTPFGLIRGGVAPDHQTTKRVAKKYEQTALRDEVNFYGNVELGRDVSLRELRETYDAVVLAVGAPNDRKLTIPGSEKYGVFGSAAFVGWYNGHPDFRELNPDLGVASGVVIGNGNVALDVARVLLRSAEGMAAADLPGYARSAIDASPMTDVHIVGRRGPLEAKFANVELREIGELNLTACRVRQEQLPADPDAALAALQGRERRLKEKNLATLARIAAQPDPEKPKNLHFEFCASPVEILGDERVKAVRFERTLVSGGRVARTGEFFDIPCGLVVSAIGYRSDPIDGAPFDETRGIIPNDNGRIDDGLYAVGWIKRGPTGVISSNRPDGETVAEYIRDDFDLFSPSRKPGRAGLEAMLSERGIRAVSFSDWKKIEDMERANAEGPAPREKFVSVSDMLDVLE